MKTLNVIAWSVIGTLSVGVIVKEAISVFLPDLGSNERDLIDLQLQDDQDRRRTFQAKFDLLKELEKANKLTTGQVQEKFCELQIEFFEEF